MEDCGHPSFDIPFVPKALNNEFKIYTYYIHKINICRLREHLENICYFYYILKYYILLNINCGTFLINKNTRSFAFEIL